MARLSQQKIKAEAIEIIRQHPGGIRYADLSREIAERHPETPANSIAGALGFVGRTEFLDQVSKPQRGLFVPVGVEPPAESPPTLEEHVFYAPVAEYLREIEGLTGCVPLGGSFARRRWSTPDVLGIYRPLSIDPIPFPAELVAVEVKLDPNRVVEAFGQAVSYRLFANRSYVVLPDLIAEADLDELEARCALFGIGLVLFTPDPDATDCRIVLRARRADVDAYHANEFAKKLYRHDEGKFRTLFG